MRHIAGLNTGTITDEVKNMNKLEKDFLIAWLLGMVLPALLLGVFLVATDNREEMLAGTKITEETMLQISVTPEPMLSIPVLQTDGTVIDMDLEEYLCGVVLAEMPVDFEPEALKAQSVVARTYCLRRLAQGTKHSGGAVCTDAACCQGYVSIDDFFRRGGDQSGIVKVSQAVAATAGEVILFGGELIDATYFSCSGGRTEDASAVWGNDVPYLKSIDSPGEERATHYTDSVTFSLEFIEETLGMSLSGDPDGWFRILSYTEGGGVDELSVCGQTFTGVEMRKLLSLRSTSFTVSASAFGITFHTKGYGHRVGMSQYGADAMALGGSLYDEILAHYYIGTTLAQYSPAIDKQGKNE